ncbi:replication/maintenance protein RepL [Streptomyces sp. AP-93]|uniref:replication/maintenance protein RepL n=1 Tax=Streptomyces sp. AP-93 TaxID=2929048 RepID=UPI001FAF2F7E|nr:replication/maintenance protein RepL [Streptomyces sp. AP-93]MCJ0868107.1 replication/maintenance protein RepL [Streptomyces sp. AP-93]
MPGKFTYGETVNPVAPELCFDLKPPAYKLLFWLCANQNRFKNGCVIGAVQMDMAVGTGMSQPTVSRAFKELLDAGIVRIKMKRLLLINPDYIMFGLSPDWEDPFEEEPTAEVIDLFSRAS